MNLTEKNGRQEGYRIEGRREKYGIYNERDLARMRSKPDLTARDKLVYLSLFLWINNEGILWASNKQIAEALGISVRSVERAMSNLSQVGLILKVRRFNKSSIIHVLDSKGTYVPSGTNDSPVASDNPVAKNHEISSESPRHPPILSQASANRGGLSIPLSIPSIDLKKKKDVSKCSLASKEENLPTASHPKKEDREPLDFEACVRERNIDIDINEYLDQSEDDRRGIYTGEVPF